MSIPPQQLPPPGPFPQQGAYAQPGQPGPYGGPQGWYPPPQKTNALAIVAFVMSIVCALPLVPLILGVIALSQIRNRGEKGKGFAVAAIAIHGVTLAFYSLVLILGLSGALDDGPEPRRDTGGQVTSPGSSDVQDIREGDCFNTDDDLAEYDSEHGGQAALSVRVVPCGEPHEGEAYAVFDLEDGPFPGTEKVTSIAEEKCGGTLLTDYVGDSPKLLESLDVYYYHPQSASWILGDREITCFLGDTSGTSTGSVHDTGTGT
ncbi:DUF4190 domain-containing protein [Streptomyces sp. NPDC002889]|uniref:DUF4190 domain-containing protein n=1 Tax=Streptomyces sp. NPDC002889 TaxID=3364669 RepID=UPI0036A3C718